MQLNLARVERRSDVLPRRSVRATFRSAIVSESISPDTTFKIAVSAIPWNRLGGGVQRG
jgi:hypothetical protein